MLKQALSNNVLNVLIDFIGDFSVKLSLSRHTENISFVRKCTDLCTIKNEHMQYFKKKSDKISKGYRLKPSTHKIIYRIQEIICGDQDEAIAKACRMYYRKLISKKDTEINLRTGTGLK